MNWKKALISLPLACLLLTGTPYEGYADTTQKQVSLPSFPVQINGKKMDNSRLTHPFLVYNDITYLPLTWDMTQALGIQLTLDPSGGMQLWPGGGQRSGGWFGWKKPVYPPEQSGNYRPGQTYGASVPSFAVTINDSYIDNTQEPYPLLIWNDITYLPLTWAWAHEMLRLDLRWSAEKGLNVIGGQQQVLGRIYYDDEQYLYLYPEVITERWQGGLKLRKTLNEAPVWMSADETEAIRKRMEEEERKLTGETVHLEQKEDGLYYEGHQLLPKEKITYDPNEAGHPHVRELKGRRFQLGPNVSFLTVSILVGYDYGNSMSQHYSYMIRGEKLEVVKDFPQGPDRVIPNPDGSFWLASNGMSMMRGRIIWGSRQLALASPEGELRFVNEVMDESDIFVPGLLNPAISSLLSEDGKLLIYAQGIGYKSNFTPKDTGGYYWLDTSLQTSKVDALDALVKETPYLPTYKDEWPVYLGSDHKLYIKHQRNNQVSSYGDGKMTTGQWYDDELLPVEQVD